MSILATASQTELHLKGDHHNGNNKSHSLIISGVIDLNNGDEDGEEEALDKNRSPSPKASKTSSQTRLDVVVDSSHNDQRRRRRSSSSSKSVAKETKARKHERSRSSSAHRHRRRRSASSKERSSKRNASMAVIPGSPRRDSARSRSRLRSRSAPRHSQTVVAARRRYNQERRRSSRSPVNYTHGAQRPAYGGSFGSAYGGANGNTRHYNAPYLSPDSLYDRFNAPQNNVLAVFGLDKRANEQDLFDLYRRYGCKECKIIMDKHVSSLFKNSRFNSPKEQN